ncbi:hypothetical protein IWZ01DRAFT_235868 [Phyllosticta capitalensis]
MATGLVRERDQNTPPPPPPLFLHRWDDRTRTDGEQDGGIMGGGYCLLRAYTYLLYNNSPPSHDAYIHVGTGGRAEASDEDDTTNGITIDGTVHMLASLSPLLFFIRFFFPPRVEKFSFSHVVLAARHQARLQLKVASARASPPGSTDDQSIRSEIVPRAAVDMAALMSCTTHIQTDGPTDTSDALVGRRRCSTKRIDHAMLRG